ncbi:DoxX family protein [Pseudoxanthomonas putridarboris]|uniref:DoxX family protein n=1 Tax=Pseudoxanthomonas putridarboris TaxID=752605 RepID=A0ABU9J396_9GAMM
MHIADRTSFSTLSHHRDNALASTLELAGRILLVSLFLIAGADKIANYDATVFLMASKGIPAAALPLVIALDLLGSLAVVLGWKTRIAALLLAGFTLVAGAIFHGDFSDKMNLIMFTKNVSIVGGFLLLIGRGAGRYSLDARAQGN